MKYGRESHKDETIRDCHYKGDEAKSDHHLVLSLSLPFPPSLLLVIWIAVLKQLCCILFMVKNLFTLLLRQLFFCDLTCDNRDQTML